MLEHLPGNARENQGYTSVLLLYGSGPPNAKKKGSNGKCNEKEAKVKKEAISKPKSLEYLDTSSSEEEKEEEARVESKDDQLVEMLRKAMAAYASLFTDFATMNKACRSLAHLQPNRGADSKTKGALDKVAHLSKKPKLRERVQDCPSREMFILKHSAEMIPMPGLPALLLGVPSAASTRIQCKYTVSTSSSTVSVYACEPASIIPYGCVPQTYPKLCHFFCKG